MIKGFPPFFGQFWTGGKFSWVSLKKKNYLVQVKINLQIPSKGKIFRAETKETMSNKNLDYDREQYQNLSEHDKQRLLEYEK